jgi:hypothetical protein
LYLLIEPVAELLLDRLREHEQHVQHRLTHRLLVHDPVDVVAVPNHQSWALLIMRELAHPSQFGYLKHVEKPFEEYLVDEAFHDTLQERSILRAPDVDVRFSDGQREDLEIETRVH